METTIDRIEVLPLGQIQVRQTTKVFVDGIVDPNQTTFHRHCLIPGDDLEGQDPAVQEKAREVWTEEVIAAWNAR